MRGPYLHARLVPPARDLIGAPPGIVDAFGFATYFDPCLEIHSRHVPGFPAACQPWESFLKS